MADTPPNEVVEVPRTVEREERVNGYCDVMGPQRQREASGGLSDESPEDPVRNPTPFRKLRGG